MARKLGEKTIKRILKENKDIFEMLEEYDRTKKFPKINKKKKRIASGTPKI